MEAIALLFLLLGLLTSGLFWRFKKDDFLAQESDRCLNRSCEAEPGWTPRGRMYTRGLALIEENGVKRFVKQAKLCDLSLLE